MNDCEYKSPVSNVTGFLNLCQDGTYALLCLEIMLKINDTSLESVSYPTYNVVMVSHFIVITEGTLYNKTQDATLF